MFRKSRKNLAEERFKLLSDNMAASILLRNADGEILFLSPYTEILTGYPLETLKSNFLVAIHEEDLKAFNKAYQVVSLGESYQLRFRIKHRSDIEIWAESRIVPILNDSGDYEGSLTITFDVTGQVRYQKIVEARNRELQDFSYMISHDLKSPLYTIKGMLGVIEADFLSSLSPELKEIILHIQTAHGRLESLITGILEYSRASSETIEETEVHLKEVLADIKRDFNLKDNDIDDTEFKVLGNKTKLYQIISNLVSNAIKYKDTSRELVLTIRVRKENNKVLIKVSDNGRGLTEEQIGLIFRPFHRIHRDKEGTGVGLAIVQTLVDRMGGEIKVESKLGVGTDFTVCLRGI